MSKLTTPIALQASGINARLGDAHILRDIDLALPAGRWCSGRRGEFHCRLYFFKRLPVTRLAQFGVGSV